MLQIRDGELEVPTTYAASDSLLVLLNGLLKKKPRHRLRIKDLRRDAWMTEDHARPLPVPQHSVTGHHSVQKGDLKEALLEAMVQLRAGSAFEDARRSMTEGSARFLDENKQVVVAPPPKPPARRGPGMLKRAA